MAANGAWLFEAASNLGEDTNGGNNLTEVGTVEPYNGSDVIQGAQAADFISGSLAANGLYIPDGDLDAGFPGKDGVVLTGWTLTLWARPEATGTAFPKYLCAKGNITGNVWRVSWELNSKFVARAREASGERIVIGSDGKSIDTWYFIAVRWNNSDDELTLFVNAASEGTPAAMTNLVSNTDPLVIGAQNQSASSDFPGQIDAVRIYDGFLTDSQITGMYNDPDYDPNVGGSTGQAVVLLM